MDPDYKPIHQQAEKLHFKFLDVCDNRDDPLAQSLERETKDIRECVEMNRPPRMVEDRIRQVQDQLRQAKARPVPALSPQDADMLFHAYEDLRVQLRRLPNY